MKKLKTLAAIVFALVLASGIGVAEEKVPTIHGPGSYLSVINTDTGSTKPAREVPTFNALEDMLEFDLVTVSTMTNGSTETTSYMDDDPASWFGGAERGAGPNPVDTNSTTAKIGTNSLILQFPADAPVSAGVQRTIVSDDLEANESVGFWFRSSTALTSGDLILTMLDDSAGTTTDFNFPAVAANAVDTWTWTEIDISGLGAPFGDAITEIGIRLSSAGAASLGAFSCYIDGMWKWDAADEETLSHPIRDSGVISVLTYPYSEATSNVMTKLTENTDYFPHYQSGNDAIVIITDQSLYSGMALVLY